ncbi:MipA/OmpV family protein [Stenotrophomonas mori]|uniref:MipA/OmpV family protein n=1 Tax=Stenotrophomonas mori TaxID=2871096 RepID=A0ABT0SFC9_9GAMM|nr:MipA/OmpV family protein [Stenotrophomonas mori]MCL7714008.1 MipA/OmpV family protein [Stenotrophomonas mori]
MARATDADAPEKASVAFGLGGQSLPGWMGAPGRHWQTVPFFNIELPDIGELSSTDGLRLYLPHEGPWEIGLYGDYLWGRSRADLGPVLGGKVPSLSPRIHAGVYSEYAVGGHGALGARLGHDLKGGGAYLDAYYDHELPPMGYIQHGLELGWRGMNRTAMNRYFGLSASSAAQLQVAAWAPGAGSQQLSANYSAFVPTSRHTGFAVMAEYARLLGGAASSPLVRQFGNRHQWQYAVAFVRHF